MAFFTRYEKKYEGVDAHKQVHDDFTDITLELDNFAHKLDYQHFDPWKEESGYMLPERARAIYMLPDNLPISAVLLLATKYHSPREAKLILEIKHFLGNSQIVA